MSTINLRDFAPALEEMGPGLRACIWVQGCPMACKGCITPEFIPDDVTNEVTVMSICNQIRQAQDEHGIIGVSFSGGEPFMQAHTLAMVARFAQKRGLSTLAWTGFTRAHLESPNAPFGSTRFIRALDVLIDGPFVQSRAAKAPPLRGSTNQQIHLLTDRHTMEECEERKVSMKIEDDKIVTTGVHDFRKTEALMRLFGI